MKRSNSTDQILQHLGAIEERLKAIERAQQNATITITRQLEAFIQLHSLIGPIPGQLHGWPISADFALHMLELLIAEPPELVIEFGSGTSTYLLLQGLAHAYPKRSGHAKEARSAPQLLSYEHLPQYHQQTARLIAPCRLLRHAQLLLAPLESWSDSDGIYNYYSNLQEITTAADALRRKREIPLKRLLVVVDGPPGSTGRQARYPALPALLKSVPVDPARPLQVTLLMDDMNRQDEQTTVVAWEELLGDRGIHYSRQDLSFEKGAMTLRFTLGGT